MRLWSPRGSRRAASSPPRPRGGPADYISPAGRTSIWSKARSKRAGGDSLGSTGPRVGRPAWLRERSPSPRLDALDRAPALDSHSSVEHDAAVGRAPDRVEVSLDHLGDLAKEQGKAQDQLAKRRAVERSGTPEPVYLQSRRRGRSRSVRRSRRRSRAAGGTRPFRQARPGARRGRPQSRSPDRDR